MIQLTKAEEQIMQILWSLGEGIVQDVRQAFSDPKPSRNTISTVIRILEQKGFVEHKAYGRTYLYFPKIAKEEYTKRQMSSMIHNYFNGSFASMASFFVKENDLSMSELDELLNQIKKNVEH
ncbi:MAG: CopY family transcriptional repressor [Bacteroidetes bacterium]|nr:CopY family transcriptional repressor [Bacteroidota bacterium]